MRLHLAWGISPKDSSTDPREVFVSHPNSMGPRLMGDRRAEKVLVGKVGRYVFWSSYVHVLWYMVKACRYILSIHAF